jgi:hypothetical protein
MQSTAPQFDFNQPILAWSPNLAVTSITHAGEPVRYREDVLAVPAPLGSCGSSTGAPQSKLGNRSHRGAPGQGSAAVQCAGQAEASRAADAEGWREVSVSTDVNFLGSMPALRF